jgi:hypothetical protein
VRSCALAKPLEQDADTSCHECEASAAAAAASPSSSRAGAQQGSPSARLLQARVRQLSALVGDCGEGTPRTPGAAQSSFSSVLPPLDEAARCAERSNKERQDDAAAQVTPSLYITPPSLSTPKTLPSLFNTGKP